MSQLVTRLQEESKVTSEERIVEASTNETPVSSNLYELEPYVRVVKPSRPSLTYDRIRIINQF